MNIKGTWYYSPKENLGYCENITLGFGNSHVSFTLHFDEKIPAFIKYKEKTEILKSYTLLDVYHACGSHLYRTKFSEVRELYYQKNNPKGFCIEHGTNDVEKLPDSYFRQIDDTTLKFNFKEEINDTTCMTFVREPEKEPAEIFTPAPSPFQSKLKKQKYPDKYENEQIDST